MTPEQIRANAEMQETYLRWHNCSACSLKASRACILWGFGSASAPFMIINSTVGWFENRDAAFYAQDEVRAFMQGIFQMHDLTLNDLYVTAAVKCLPPYAELSPEEIAAGERPKRMSPPAASRKACMPALQRQLAIVKPAVILIHGAVANQMLLEDPRSLVKYRGHARPLRDSNAIVVSTHNPAGLMMPERRPLISEYMTDFKYAMELLDGWGRAQRPDAALFQRGWTCQ